MFQSILTRLMLAYDSFVRTHICDDAKNIWPGITDQELLDAERR